MDTGDYIDGLVSHAQTLGVFEAVNGHEPKRSPGSGMTCAVWAQTLEPARGKSGLAASTVRLVMNVRLYLNMLKEPQDYIDPQMVGAADQLMNAYSGDFTLDGMIRNVDLLGEAGPPMRAEAGYQDVGGDMCRIITITVPLLINDAWNQEA